LLLLAIKGAAFGDAHQQKRQRHDAEHHNDAAQGAAEKE